MGSQWFYRRGQLAREGWETVVDDAIDGWRYAELRVGAPGAGGRLRLERLDVERIVIPLAGSFTVDHDDGSGPGRTELRGRAGVFSGPTDVLYLPSSTRASITGAGRVAVAAARTTARYPVRHLRAQDVPVELRGAGTSTRQIHNFGTVGVLAAAKLIVCEVITPAGNWSSYPPHKHDELVPGVESRLEEIYYFEATVDASVAAPAADADPFGMFATYSSAAGRIEVNALVRTGDVSLVPYGYHGPAAAAPGYHLYYLNVMAGPGAERAWNITDDPAHAWVRRAWNDEVADPRLPLRG